MTRKVEEFQPIDKSNVKIYSCGPTVYVYPHIGNWFAFIHWDLLNRMLIASGFKTTWVMNITDVGHLVSDADEGEDKLEKGAKREGKSAWDVAKFYEEYFLKGIERLNFLKPDFTPKATDYIPEQIDLIKELEKDGFTYTIDDGVYFDTSKLVDYGKLAKLDIHSLKEGARVEINVEKRNPTDFALWKFSPKDHKRDMEWESPWGTGFPGWHLECSAMIKKLLGATIDIHTGGIDHIPVHHTNEIAQSETAFQQPLANYWMHTNFIKVDGQKISKSLNNFFTLEDIEAKGFSLQAFRLLVLESHYRSESQFSWETMQAAQNRLKSYQDMADLKWQAKDLDTETNELFDTKSILEAMQEDLNSPLALSIISSKADILSDKLLPKANLKDFNIMLEFIDSILGMQLSNREDITDDQKTLLTQRQEARDTKDWTKSDGLRDQLTGEGIEVRDTYAGQIWSRLCLNKLH